MYFLEFVRLMVNPPHGAAEAYIHDPVFGNTFDGVQITGNDGTWAKPVLSAAKLMVEFQEIVDERSAGFETLDEFLVGLLNNNNNKHVDI